jgi:hypothetical protein
MHPANEIQARLGDVMRWCFPRLGFAVLVSLLIAWIANPHGPIGGYFSLLGMVALFPIHFAHSLYGPFDSAVSWFGALLLQLLFMFVVMVCSRFLYLFATIQRPVSGLVNGLIGVLIFSGSLPATRVAVQQIDPAFLTVARATIAGLLGLCLLLAFREKRPARADVIPLVIVALGVVVGFPLLTALALKYVTSAHSIVFIGLLPLATYPSGEHRLAGGMRLRES